MSLINDVLRQLDARVPVMQPERIYVETSSVPGVDNNNLLLQPVVKFFTLIIIGLSSGYYFMAAYRASSYVDQSRPVVTSVSNLTDVHSTLSIGQVASEELTSTGRLNPVELSPVQLESSMILLTAKRLYLTDRLTYPPLNNAYQLYREILLKDPNNEEALKGVVAIRQRYVILAAEAVTHRDREKAQRYIERAEFVGAEPADLASVRAQLDILVVNEEKNIEPIISGNEDASIENIAMNVNNSSVIDMSAIASGGVPITSAPVDIKRLKNSETVQGLVSHLNEPAEKNIGSLSGGKNKEKLDEQNFIAGLNTRSDSDVQALNYIKSHANSSDTVRWLARRWVSAQAWLQLLDLMNIPSALTPIERDVFRAQGLMGLKKYQDIIGWLGATKRLEQPELQRILALAWQQTGHQVEAFTLYQQLVVRNPDNSGLWLALGISADAIGNKSAAHEAFFRAQQLGGHAKVVNEFIGRKLNEGSL
jgi:tetratricopeptide (TPR) repeat protein